MPLSYPKTTKALLLLLLLVGLFGLQTHFVYAANEVPVHDADLINTAKQQLKQESKTASEQQKATDNQLLAWHNTFKVELLKKEILDIFSEKIIGYIQNGYGGDDQNPGPLFVTNWMTYLQVAEAKGRENEIKKIQNEANNQHFCFSEQVIKLLRNPDAHVTDEDSNCLLSNGDQTPLSTAQDENSLYAESCTTGPQPTCGSPYDTAIGAFFLPDKSLNNNNTDATKAYYEQDLNDTFAIYKERVDKAAELAQRAAEDEAIASGGFLSTKDIHGKSDPLGHQIIPDDPSNPDAIITTPGIVNAHLAQQAAGLDLQYILAAQNFDKDALQIIGDSFLYELSNVDSAGLTNLNLCAHAQARENRDAAANKTTATQIDCDTFDKEHPVASSGSTNGVTDGKTDASAPDNASELIAKVNELINGRGVAANAFKEAIKGADEHKALFDDGTGHLRKSNNSNLPFDGAGANCRANYYGRLPVKGEPSFATTPPHTVPSGASEVDLHKRYYKRSSGTYTFLDCMTEDDFDHYSDFVEEVTAAQATNKKAIDRLTAFRDDIQALVPTDEDYPAQVAEKTAEFKALSVLVNSAMESCDSTAAGSYDPGVGGYDSSSKTWTGACYEYAFSAGDADHTENVAQGYYDQVQGDSDLH